MNRVNIRKVGVSYLPFEVRWPALAKVNQVLFDLGLMNFTTDSQVFRHAPVHYFFVLTFKFDVEQTAVGGASIVNFYKEIRFFLNGGLKFYLR